MSSRILIVEDDAVTSLSIRETLTLVGYEVAGIAATVSDALCIAQNTHPHLALMDVHLAGRRDGIEGALLLRQLDIPVVFLTAQGDGASLSRAEAAKPLGYLLKPIHSQQLLQAVDAALLSASGAANREQHTT